MVHGRVLAPAAYRPPTFGEVEDTPEWWSALGTFGALLLAAAILTGVGSGEVLAIAGVAFFLAAGVFAGAERIETATAVGVAAIVWTTAGIWVVRGGDSSPIATLVGLAVVGTLGLALGVAGTTRALRRTKPSSDGAR